MRQPGVFDAANELEEYPLEFNLPLDRTSVQQIGADELMRITRRTTRGLESRSLSTLTYGLSAVLDTIRRRPDVALVMNCANGYWLPLLKLAGIPTVVNVDGIEWERAKWGRFAKAVFKTGARMTASARSRPA